MSDEFEFDNLIGRPTGPYLSVGTKLLKGIRNVQEHIPVYAAQWRESNREEMKLDKPLWVVLGDSMAQGIGASAYDRGWAGYLRKYLRAKGQDYRLLNLSISGARISDLLERQLPVLEALGEKPALVTMMIGSNNMARKVYRERAPKDYIELLRHMPAGSVIANLPGPGSMQTAVEAMLQLQAAEGKVVVVDMRRRGPSNWRDKLSSDHFHPNDAGYDAMAKVFARAMGLL